eukprot:UN25484
MLDKRTSYITEGRKSGFGNHLGDEFEHEINNTYHRSRSTSLNEKSSAELSVDQMLAALESKMSTLEQNKIERTNKYLN